KEFDQAGDNLATASYPFQAKAIADPYAPLEVLLSKKSKSLHAKPTPLKPRPDAIARFLTPSPDRSRRHRFMHAMPSPRAVDCTQSDGSFMKEFDQAGDNLATASYPFQAKAIADPYAPLEVLLSKKSKSLHAKPTPLKSSPSSSKSLDPSS
nr:hypothetical protein [Tanacetum cinerariifolium]